MRRRVKWWYWNRDDVVGLILVGVVAVAVIGLLIAARLLGLV